MFRPAFNSPSIAAQTAQRFFQSLRIVLVRHGKSEGNVDPIVWQTTADHAIHLSEGGRDQARQAGRFLKNFYEENPLPACFEEQERTCRSFGFSASAASGRIVWTSPYTRARETAQEMIKAAGPIFDDTKEHIGLAEQQFGLFEGIPDEELPTRFPAEFNHYTKCKDFGGRFWARYPLGESRFDVAMRVHQVFEDLYHDADKHRDILVVTHGVTLRAFLMMFLKRTPEWFEAEPNPKNCAIRLIGKMTTGFLCLPAVTVLTKTAECGEDKGTIFEGFS